MAGKKIHQLAETTSLDSNDRIPLDRFGTDSEWGNYYIKASNLVGTISGSGTANKLVKWNTSSTLTNSGFLAESVNGISLTTGYLAVGDTVSATNSLLIKAVVANTNIADFKKTDGTSITTISNSGFVGINKSTPSATLHIKSTGTTILQVEESTSSILMMKIHNTGAISLGRGGAATGDESIALGYGTTATNSSTVLGSSSSGTGTYAVVIGAGCNTAVRATVVGSSSSASGGYAVALGQENTASGVGAYAMGYLATSSADYAYALGTQTTSSHAHSYAIGRGATTGATNQIILGSSASYVYKVGINTNTTDANLHIKTTDNSSSSKAILIKNLAGNTLFVQNNDGSFAIGKSASNYNSRSVTIGESATTTHQESVALGALSSAGLYTVALGDQAVGLSNCVVIGKNATTSSNDAISIGGGSTVNGLSSYVFGVNNTINGSYITCLGYSNTYTGGGSGEPTFLYGESSRFFIENVRNGIDREFKLRSVTSDGTTTLKNSAILLLSSYYSGSANDYECNIKHELLTTSPTSMLNISFGGTSRFKFYSSGKANFSNLQIGNAGLSTGDLYQDTAANILAAGDKIVAIKV